MTAGSMIVWPVSGTPPEDPTLSTEEFFRAADVLGRLDVPPGPLGYSQTACALALSARDPQRLQLVSKWLYPDVAEVFSTSPACVERNIRRVRTMVWQNSRDTLFDMIGHPLARRPGNARFLAYLAASLTAEQKSERY